ncbi:olfactory receptor 5B21-like [Tachyglossus aculeatus]|uniref:olfactory receptor 5B21-like n=1 Tax=Tachyglossus aculeatus TaxID=9261 RepID=UPI0018F3A5A3|nr:olfactory receptor 5B21-like [Tachyglossus aculeatus]
MAEGNRTGVIGFLLKRLSDRPEVRFAAFDVIYSATPLANGVLLLAFYTDRHFHSPIYFFFVNLSLLDVSHPTAAVPKILRGLATGDRRSRWPGKNVFLLDVSASEHLLAVLRPLHYDVHIDGRVYVVLVAGAWPTRFLKSPLHVSFTFTMFLCRSNLVDQYYCDVPLVTGLSRFGGSYVLVIATILKSPLAEVGALDWALGKPKQKTHSLSKGSLHSSEAGLHSGKLTELDVRGLHS